MSLYHISVDHEDGRSISGSCLKRDWEGKPTALVDYNGKVYTRNNDGTFS